MTNLKGLGTRSQGRSEIGITRMTQTKREIDTVTTQPGTTGEVIKHQTTNNRGLMSKGGFGRSLGGREEPRFLV